MRVLYWLTQEYSVTYSFNARIQLWWFCHSVTFSQLKHFPITSLLLVHHFIFIRTKLNKKKLASVLSEKEKHLKNKLEN